ncbi:sugar ABC transporter substrate-binding protein [Chelativorans xinjiangense]|uniref:sugar ABC transporter substrate-binding protein n=1 Tax=Chelativorans xinjiangense TaxID=2681485 RepID=UPI001359AC02|nr:sugar ABC transporter substrate-binding protein [Chelativorans xinjiangense]
MLKKFHMLTAAAALGLAAFTNTAASQDQEWKVAFFASSAQNGFNQAVYEGIKNKAQELGNVETAIYDGQFDAAQQYSQIEDVLASGEFDGFIVVPNDTVGIAGVVEMVAETGKPLATALFPIGSDLSQLEPQVPGVTTTVAGPPADGARKQAEDVVEYCADKNPCNVVIIVGQRIFPFDNLRYEAYREVLDQHDNIEVVATGEGNYDPDKSLTAMQDILQANSNVDVVLTNADQHLIGVEIALEAAGYDVPEVYLSGGGAASVAVNAIREGRWDVTLAHFPVSMGEYALDAVVQALKGETPPSVINMDEVGPVPPLVNAKVLEEHPDFEGEWAQ